MLENEFVIWNVNKLAQEFNLSKKRVNMILRSLGAKKWTGKSGVNGTKYYYDPEED